MCIFLKRVVLTGMFTVLTAAGAMLTRADQALAEIASASASANAPLTFVYVHGFGGVKKSPEFCVKLSRFLDEKDTPAAVINYEWDSVRVDPLQPGASWLKSQQMADLEAEKFRREVLDRLEDSGRRYVLVGFSVGTRVLLHSLQTTTTELQGLQGLYFLGSAMTKDTTLENRTALPKGMKITNYHSPTRDFVHRLAFNLVSEVPPGGQLGFDDVQLFENLPVSCAHAHKGLAIATDYSGLAEAIAFLELHQAGIEVPGRTKLNWEMPVDDSELWWNTISLQNQVALEQHSMRPGYYRAVRVGGDGKRTRIARGENLHAILKALAMADGVQSEQRQSRKFPFFAVRIPDDSRAPH